MWAGILEEEEGKEGYHLLLLVEQADEAADAVVEGPEAPIDRFEDQEEHQVDCDRDVAAVVVAGSGCCHVGKEGDCAGVEVRREEPTQREAAGPGHDHEILEGGPHEHAGVYPDVALVQLVDRQAAVDYGDHACQIRERPRTMAT